MKRMLSKRRVLTTLCVFILAAATLCALFACVSKVTDTVIAGKTSAKKVVAFSALTTASMMSANFAQIAEQSAPSAAQEHRFGANEPTAERPETVGGDAEELNRYLKMFEGYLVGNGVNEIVGAPTEADGVYAKHTYKVTMKAPRLDGAKDLYTLYYSEFEQASDRKLEYEDDFDEDDADEDRDGREDSDRRDEIGYAPKLGANGKHRNETEVSTRLEGTMLCNGAVYPIAGAKNVEEEDGETETEIVFTTYLKDGDPDNYIKVEQETENGEAEYSYTVVKDGQIVSKTKVEVENDAEENEQEVELTFLDAATGTPSKTKYSFERKFNADGSAEIVIEYSVSGAPAGTIRVKTEADGSYRFIYDNGAEENLH